MVLCDNPQPGNRCFVLSGGVGRIQPRRLPGKPAGAEQRSAVGAMAGNAENSEEMPWLGPRRLAARLLSRRARRHNFGWGDLAAELDRCPAPVAFWWRDDDAVAATPALDRLLALRAQLELPLALAVIPAKLADTLPKALEAEPAVGVLQHGWNHANHAPDGAQPSEFPGSRASGEVEAQLAEGRHRLAACFGGRFIPALVPPFNALDGTVIGAVQASGLARLSLASDFAGLALPSRNVHADLIDWRSGTAVPEASAIRALVVALRLRRFGLARATKPIGIMTHHLVHDEAVWSLTRSLLTRLKAHPNAVFAPISGIFA